ncbi:hypothetical protein [Epilithonimonas lactis]|uniref:Dolichyl-phosphate-mannose-protein mannosyltransferase n=1 Tax=Epilithonimonas lactis TaxID=421072 RepID=A0A085BLG9_9FLAO|nr:hypothetical protein [Epilithonimonas lactis]KFC23314.1 hypothetical protein IO89_01610 [Epilithonimonas lactis]
MAKYIVLAVLIIILNFIHSFFLPSGGVYADSLSYFEIASDLPDPVTNLFPLGYPAMLRGFFEVFGDYFWAAKFLNTSMLVVILLFSYFKSFYFKETVLLMTGKTILFVFSIAISEGLFVFLLYFLLYYLNKILLEHRNSYKNILIASLIMLAMFVSRYSGIYVYLSIGAFSVYLFFKGKDKMQIRGMILFLLLSGLGIAGYLLFNYNIFGSFTGENLRGKPEEILPIYIIRDLFGTANAIDPYIGLKPSSNSMASLVVQFFVLMTDVFVFLYFLRYFKRAKASSSYYFHALLWTVAVGYALSLLVSGCFQQIEEMNTRMMAAANVCLFFSFLILYFKNSNTDKVIFRVACFFVAFFTLYSLKNPVNYFENRNQIEPQMPKFSHKKYLYNDDRGGADALTTYHIPIINKTFQYKHTNNQKGDVKQSIAGTINPKIKWLKYDTIKDRSQVLYTSELILK